MSCYKFPYHFYDHLMIGIRIGHGKYYLCIPKFGQCDKEFGKLVSCGSIFQRNGVKCDEKVLVAKFPIKRHLKFISTEQFQAPDVVNAQCANLKNMIGIFAELNHAPAIFFRCYKMQLRHFGD